MRYLFVFVFIIFSFGTMMSQFEIRGTVSDQQGNYLNFASVFLEDSKFAVATDEFGQFVLKGLPENEYMLIASYLGFRDYESIFYLEKDTVIDIVLEGSAFGLDEVEIKGTWAKDDYPFAMTNLTADELDGSINVADAPYLLQFTPSVVVSSDGGTGVGYTGIRVRGVDPTRVNVTVNGIPLNDAESQSVYWVDLPDIMNSVEQIQIQRGVGTSTNGSGAFGATINLNTNKVKLDPYLNLEGSYGDFNTTKLGVELGTGLLNDKFTIDGRFSRINTDGYVERASSDLSSIYLSAARLSNKQSLRFNLFSGHEITYQAWYGLPVQYLNDEQRRFNAAGIDGDFEKETPYEKEIDNYRQIHYQLFWERELANDWDMETGLHYTRGLGYYEQFKNDQDLFDYGLASAEGKESDLVRRKWLDNHFFGLVYNMEKSFDQTDVLIGGGLHDYLGRHFGEVDTVYDQPVSIPLGHAYYDNDGNKLDFNIYSKVQQHFGSLSAFLDLQYRLVNYKFLGVNDDRNPLDQKVTHHFFNPKAGLFYKINSNLDAFVSFAMANREPNRDDYTETEISKRPDPERLFDYEAGTTYRSEYFSAGLNLYYMKYKDQMVLTGQINDVGDAIKINVDDSYRAGVELDLKAKIMDFVDIGGALTLSNNKIDSFTEYIDDWDTWGQVEVQHEDTDISFSPNIIASGELALHPLRKNDENPHALSIVLSSKYVGKQYLDNTMNEGASLDPFTYSDLRLSYAFEKGWFKNVSLDFTIMNLFNSKYVSNGWVYRYKSADYDPLPYDPYSVQDRGEIYNMLGLFPQATRHYMLRFRLGF